MELAHRYLDGLKGIEIGGSAHNAFNLDTLNVDYTNDMETEFKRYEELSCGSKMSVDVVAEGDDLPFSDAQFDFVVSSHVLEHFPDPIKAIKEWLRVIKVGGYILMIIPHKERTFDSVKQRTTLGELIARHKGAPSKANEHGHCSVWVTEDIAELMRYLKLTVWEVEDIDSKVGNGFTFLLKKL